MEPTTPTNNTGNTGAFPPTGTTYEVVGNWTHIKDEVFYNSGVRTEIVQCGNTLEIYPNLETREANCIGGGVINDLLYKQDDIYISNRNEDVFVYTEGEFLRRHLGGDYPITIQILRRN